MVNDTFSWKKNLWIGLKTVFSAIAAEIVFVLLFAAFIMTANVGTIGRVLFITFAVLSLPIAIYITGLFSRVILNAR